MTTIQVRRGTSAQWTAANTALAQGEIGFEVDTGKLKIGDGSTVWNSLGYITKDSVAATFTNKTISGSSNTLTNIAVSSLATTGSASATTYLNGNGAWATPTAGISTGKAIAMAMIFGG